MAMNTDQGLKLLQGAAYACAAHGNTQHISHRHFGAQVFVEFGRDIEATIIRGNIDHKDRAGDITHAGGARLDLCVVFVLAPLARRVPGGGIGIVEADQLVILIFLTK